VKAAASTGNGDLLAPPHVRCKHPYHYTHSAVAKCVWRRADVDGRGPWATLAHCRVLTVHLHQDRADAEDSLDWIHRYGCGAGCTRAHALAYVESKEAPAARGVGR